MGERAGSLPAGAYAIQVQPAGPGLSFDELKLAVGRAVESATRERVRRTGVATR